VQGGPLWRVKWARPEFGLIIATCSLDRSVKIFEKKKNKWLEQTKISDSKEGIEDIKFSPRHAEGLFLASASADGNLRIYEAQEPTNLKNWMLKHNIMVNDLGLNCLSWNKSQVDRMMIAVGCKDLKTTHKKTMMSAITDDSKPTLQFLVC
jgi:WD40 repeat protein